jgi:hypothetical protein
VPDPMTIGALAAWALGTAAEALGKGVLGEVSKDAYKRLKDKVVQWAGGDVAALEKAPTSESRKTVIAEIIDLQSEQDLEALRLLIEELVSSFKNDSKAIGLDIGSLTDVETYLRKVTVTDHGIGVTQL